MNRSSRRLFLALVAAQAAHSVEEYLGRLYDVLPPARFVSGLVSSDRAAGFILVNAALVGFGLWCGLSPVRRGAPSARAIAWLWTILELANGTAHLGWTAAAGAYRPGAATAPLLVAAAFLLGASLVRPRRLDSRA